MVSFTLNFCWAYWANNAENITPAVTLKAAIVQGVYSGFVAVFFTLILESVVNKYKASFIPLAFVTPIICKFYSKTPQNLAIRKSFNNSINLSAIYLNDKRLAGSLFAPLIPITVQSTLVVTLNMINSTPNVLLTVLPSITFTALYAYAYAYMFTLLKSAKT
jgi:hypothetical protein